MSTIRRASLAVASGLILSMQPVHAERTEIVRQARMFATPSCPITPDEVTDPEWADATKESVLLAGVVAGLVGELVKVGQTAVGDALENASKEKGIVKEATTPFFMSRINVRDDSSKTAKITSMPTCLVLYADGAGDVKGFASDPQLKAALTRAATADGVSLPIYDGTTTVVDLLRDAGIEVLPSLYVEARVIPIREGIVIRPVLVWYRERLDRAPSSKTAAELHVNLAVPGAADLGTSFANARLLLPKLSPGDALDWKSLRSTTSVVFGGRPTTGFVETRLASMNTAYALVGTKKKELITADRTLASMIRKDRVKSTAETREALEAARLAQVDATSDLASANASRDGLESVSAGATNAKVRFVVVRDENAFGLAIAKALKGQAEAAGKAATTALTPKSEWAASDTGYATALAAVATKQREYDTAVGTGPGDIAKLADELFVLKAKLNEAAAATNRPIPYPSLL
ncbi:hypothetical protein [Sphingomonas aurantiaca]|uniref:hypothetical protein n=1 Tax=Sphingomonas aurantiaca TaxID=185949 RepID=UPI00336038AC